jgi:hypothetical protein
MTSIRPFLFSLAGAASLLATTPAWAAGPTVRECLAANAGAAEARNSHKLREGLQNLLVCASASCPGEIRAECASHVSEVTAAIPTIVFGVKDGSGSDLIAVKVTMDGEVIAEKLDGMAISVDPGQHAFTFETAGQPPVTKTYLIQEGQKDRREAITLGAAPVAPPQPLHVETPPPPVVTPPSLAPSPPVPEPATAPEPTRVPATTESSGSFAWSITGFVAAGASLIAASALGISSISEVNSIKQNCQSNSCPPDLKSKADDASTQGNFSTAFFILAGGGVLFGVLMLPHGSGHAAQASTIQLGFGPGSLTASGSF